MLSLSYYAQQDTGDLVRRILTDSTCIRDLAIGIILPLLTALVTLFSMFWIMWQMHPILSLLAIWIAPLLFILIKIFLLKIPD